MVREPIVSRVDYRRHPECDKIRYVRMEVNGGVDYGYCDWTGSMQSMPVGGLVLEVDGKEVGVSITEARILFRRRKK